MSTVSPRIAWRPREVKLITGLTMSAKHGNAYTPALVAGINQLGTLAIDNWHIQNPSGAILKLDHWAAPKTAQTEPHGLCISMHKQSFYAGNAEQIGTVVDVQKTAHANVLAWFVSGLAAMPNLANNAEVFLDFQLHVEGVEMYPAASHISGTYGHIVMRSRLQPRPHEQQRFDFLQTAYGVRVIPSP